MDTKYLKLIKVGQYEYVTRLIGKRGAAMIIPFMCCGEKDKENYRLQLILSVRPTFDKPILEFPAGLLDDDTESIEETALRELKEETGWEGKVAKSNRLASPSSSGLTDEVLYFVMIELSERGETSHTGNEKITVLPLMSPAEILSYIEEHKNEIYVSSRLHAFIQGIEFEFKLKPMARDCILSEK